MNRLELRRLSLEFRRVSSNLLNSTDDTADINLSRFLKFIDGNELISGLIEDKISGVDYDFKECYAIGCSGWANFNPPEDEACHIKAQYDYLLFINNEDRGNVRGQAMRYCWSSRKINDNIQSFLDMAFKPLIDFINDYLSVSVKPSPAKTNRQAPTSLPVCLIIMVVFFGKIHPFPKCSFAFSVAFVQKQIAVWIIKLFRLLPLLEKCGFYNLKYPTVEIFARCGTICFYAVQDKISKEIFLVHRITVF